MLSAYVIALIIMIPNTIPLIENVVISILDAKNKRIVGFIDLGHSQLTIFFAEFTTKTINILAVCSERFCGARDLDYLIAEKISYEFQKKYGTDLMDLPKAKISLLNAINKARKELTVNQESKIIIDEIIKGKDLVHNLTRKQKQIDEYKYSLQKKAQKNKDKVKIIEARKLRYEQNKK